MWCVLVIHSLAPAINEYSLTPITFQFALYTYYALSWSRKPGDWKKQFLNVHLLYRPDHDLSRDRFVGLHMEPVEMERLETLWPGLPGLKEEWERSHSGEALIIFGAMYEASNTLEDGAVEVRPANMDDLHQIEGPRASLHRQETVRAHLFRTCLSLLPLLNPYSKLYSNFERCCKNLL